MSGSGSGAQAFGDVLLPPMDGGLRLEVTIPAGGGGAFIVPAHGLHYVKAGRVRAVVDGMDRIVEAGALMTVPPGPRRMQTLAETVVQTVAVPDAAFTGRFGAEPAILDLSRRDQREWAERMESLVATTDEASRLEAARSALGLREERAQERARHHFDLVQRVLAFLGETLDRAPTLHELSDRFGFAPNYLNDVLSASTGRSIRQWTIAFRLEAARSALRRRSASITAVASQFGFEPAYFARRFAGRYSLSPAAWRALAGRTQAGLDEAIRRVSPHGVRLDVPQPTSRE